VRVLALLALSASLLAQEVDWVERLAKGARKERVKAARELGRAGGSDAIAALELALDDADEEVRTAAASALVRLDAGSAKVVDVSSDALSSESWYVRWQACLVLRGMGPDATDAVPPLLNALFDEKADVTQEAFLALCAIAPFEDHVLAAFVRLLESDLKVDRAALLTRLAKARRLAPCKSWLAEELRANRHGLRERAYELLRRIGAFDVWTKAVEDPDAHVRGLAAEALGKRRHPDAVPALLKAAADESVEVRRSAMRALGELGPAAAQAVPRIVEAFADGDRGVRLAAVEAAARLQRPGVAAGPGLVRVLGAADEVLVAKAREALRAVGATAFESTLVTGWDRTGPEPVWRVRLRLAVDARGNAEVYGGLLGALRENRLGKAYVEALRAILDADVEPHLREVLARGASPKARECAAFLLGRLARDEEKARAALEKARLDASGEVRAAAREAVEQLGSR